MHTRAGIAKSPISEQSKFGEAMFPGKAFEHQSNRGTSREWSKRECGNETDPEMARITTEHEEIQHWGDRGG